MPLLRYHIWSGHLVALWLTGTLVVFAATALTAALESWVGLVGTGLAMLVLFILGNPGSGGVYPPEFLPDPYRGLHTWLPTGQATGLVRAVEYFGGQSIAQPVAGLAAWTVAGLLAIVGATLVLGRRHPRLAIEAGPAAPPALGPELELDATVTEPAVAEPVEAVTC